MRIRPPKTDAFPESRVPKVFPISSPQIQITNVTAPMISDSRMASKAPWPAIAKPTERASIDVALP